MANEVSSNVNCLGSRYGDVVVADNARVQMGDIHYHQNPVPAELDLDTWRGRFFDALSYDDMNGKSQQLDSIDAPTVSFDWVERTRIPEWLEEGSGIFWISGKPGSGKSVLMKHLVSSNSTKRRLTKWKKGCLMLEFFFDFRAARREANDISGMLKLFLFQLSRQSDAAAEHFRQLNASEELEGADVAKLSTIISNTVQRCDLPVCAFVDGLDEYEGDWVNLIDLLQRLEDRTGMKICLASRPEPQLKELLHTYSTIIMQDYNIASIRVYTERALIRARRSNPDVGAKFTESLKDEIMLKAQGIVLWARLAVDELIRACNSGKSVDEMQQILDTLPPEIEEMYQRILSKLNSGFAAECATLLQIINTWNGDISLQQLFGLWDLFVEDFPIHVEDFHNMSMFAFCQRMDHILGTLVDLLPNDHVRLLHRTLHDYLRATAWVDQNIPQVFEELFPGYKGSQICAYVVNRATADNIVTGVKLDNCLAGIGSKVLDHHHAQAVLREACDFNENTHWPRRIPMVIKSILQLPSYLELENIHQKSTFPTILSALKSPLMLVACHNVGHCRSMFRNGLDDHVQGSVIDLIFAVGLNKTIYVKRRLQTLSLNARQIQALLDISIDKILADVNAAQAAFFVAEAMFQRGACRTRYHPCLLMLYPWSRRRAALPQVRTILSACPQDPNTENHYVGCRDHHSNTSPLLEWVQRFNQLEWTPRKEVNSLGINRHAGASVSQFALELILDFGEDINKPCYARGTALHAAVDLLLYNADGDGRQLIMTLEILKNLITVGANPRVKHLGSLPYDYAKELQSALTGTEQARNGTTDADGSRSGRFKRGIQQLLGKQNYESQKMVPPREMLSILELLKPKWRV